MVTGLLPHVRQFVRVRQALVRAEARNATVTALLDNPRTGVIHLDRRGRIMVPVAIALRERAGRRRPTGSISSLRALTEITLPRATRANPRTTGWAWVQLATLYRPLS